MKIDKIISQYRRDFNAVFVCEGCGYQVTLSGYDDEHYHKNTVPKIKCPKCGRTGKECGAEYRPLTTKYPEGYQI